MFRVRRAMPRRAHHDRGAPDHAARGPSDSGGNPPMVSGRPLPGRAPESLAVAPRPTGSKILVVESHRRLAAGVGAVVGDDFQIEEARDTRQALVALGA